ncbi:MAG: capsule assembly Wzi family protein [Melioribacteraceae bacterium]
MKNHSNNKLYNYCFYNSVSKLLNILQSSRLCISTSKLFHVSAFLHFIFLLFTFYLSLFTSAFAQVNFEPVTSSVYSFLERMSSKGIIQTNEEIMPFSRMEIAEKLLLIHNSKFSLPAEERIQNSKITNIEKVELEFYIREFSVELKKLGLDLNDYEAKRKLIDFKNDKFGFDKYNRFRLFSYSDNNFGLFIDPVLSYSYNSFKDGNSWNYSNGLKLYGNFGSSIGFDLQFYDNHPRGDNLDRYRNFSNQTGYEFQPSVKGGFDFDRMNANFTYSWDWGFLSIGKDFNYYGSGENGKIILSDKAPSFPFIKLEAEYADWFKFSYIHSYLNSQIIDSANIRTGQLRDHYPKVEKYFVAHMFSFTPYKNLNFSLGESVVYSDRFEPIYLIPVSFFRLADHYLTDPDESAGNAQLFASIWYKNYWLRTKFYGSVFIDELSASHSEYPQAVAYNFGFKTIDPIILESELCVEYSRINPFVYFHADEAQTYASYGYEMGHWMGSNADQLFLSFKKRITRGLEFNLYYSIIRKGDEESFDEERYQDKHTFLWGDKNEITEYGAEINYEILHSLFVKAKYNYIDEKLNSKLLLYEGSLFGFSIGYGM